MTRTLALAMRAGTAARLASASARRRQIAQTRTALLMHTVQNRHFRQQVTLALARLRRNTLAFRKGLQSNRIVARTAAQKAG
jgi:hypothetical protein